MTEAERIEIQCPTCGAPCKMEWSGLDLVSNTGDETLASKNYIYINKDLEQANKNLSELLIDAEQRGENKARAENERMQQQIKQYASSNHDGEKIIIMLQGQLKEKDGEIYRLKRAIELYKESLGIKD